MGRELRCSKAEVSCFMVTSRAVHVGMNVSRSNFTAWTINDNTCAGN